MALLDCAQWAPADAVNLTAMTTPLRRNVARRGLATALLTAFAALAGCDAFRSFEQSCEARLPVTRIQVDAEQISYTVDQSQSFAQLTTKSAALAAHGQSVLGLTEAELRSTVQVSARGLGSRWSGRYCMRPEVTVLLSFNPMQILMGSDEREGSCGYRITWDHELRHVAVYQEFLPQIGTRVAQALAEHFANKVYYFANADDAQKHVDELVTGFLSPLVQNGMQEVRVMQRAVDSSAEYSRLDGLRASCPR